MSPRSCRTAALFGVLAVSLITVPQLVTPAGAVAPSSYTVPAGVEVLEVVLVGGSGGAVLRGDPDYPGGLGCRVTTPLGVAAGDSLTWLLGGDGQSTVTSSATPPGGLGGTGARPGGAGGAIGTSFAGSFGAPGAGGGAASAAYLDGVEFAVAAGGGGASMSSTGGSGCGYSTAEGANGVGAQPNAQGATTPSAGGVGGTANIVNAVHHGGNGTSATATPAGRGGVGGEGRISGSGGGGGGGGISGGGGGSGMTSAFAGSAGTGAAGLSGVTESVTLPGFALPTYAAAAPWNGVVASHLAVNAVEVTTTQLPPATVGTAYTTSLVANFGEVFTTSSSAGSPVGAVTWALATGSATLPGGLTLATTGAITGTPTSTGTFPVTFAASVLDGAQLVRARSVVTLALVVGASPSSPAQGLVTTPVDPATTSPSTSPSTSLAPSTTVAAPVTTLAPTDAAPTPVSIDGGLPELPAGEVLVVEDGEPADVNVFVDEDTLVLETDRFELRLKGDCSRDACLIDTTDEGREILTLEEAGRANVDGLGFLPGSIVDIWLFSEPRYLGSLTVAADGTFEGDVDLLNIAVGQHTLQVNGISQTGAQRSANLGVIVNPTTASLPATGGGSSHGVPLAALMLLGGALVLASRRRLTAYRP